MNLFSHIRGNLRELKYRYLLESLAPAKHIIQGDYSRLLETFKDSSAPEVDLFEQEMGVAIDRDWLDRLAFDTQLTIKTSDPSWHHGRVLYSCLREYASRVRDNSMVRVLETGTARGFASVCMARALLDENIAGTVISVDLIPHNRPIIWNVHTDASGPKTREALLSDWAAELDRIVFLNQPAGGELKRIGLSRVNFAFFDAEHSISALEQEFGFVRERQHRGDVVVFDDVTPGKFDEVVDFVSNVVSQSGYKVRYVRASDHRGYAIGTRI